MNLMLINVLTRKLRRAVRLPNRFSGSNSTSPKRRAAGPHKKHHELNIGQLSRR
jgi:hypothetical protein